MMQSTLASYCGSSDCISRKPLGKSLGGRVSQPSRGYLDARRTIDKIETELVEREDRRKFTYECLISV